MSVRILAGYPVRTDGFAGEDFELLPTGETETLPEVVGTGGCKLYQATPLPPR